MPNLNTYIKEYGNISFNEKPFCDADAVALCYISYMPFCKAVSADINEEPVPFSKACRDLFAIRGYEHKPVGLVLVKKISETMMAMANCKRFYEAKLAACAECFERKPAVQFNAATLLLPDGTVVINFQGTDDTLVGWLEDFDILIEESIPSEQLAIDYIKDVAEKYEGDIIICGHSKGGFISQYAALYSQKEIRDRIKAVYNLEGPGFRTFEFIDTEAYKEILPRYKHFVPQSSLIGMMLSHDDDYTVVKSSVHLGPMEHELSTWQIEGDSLVTCNELTKAGKISDLVMYDIITQLPPEQSRAVGKILGNIVDATHQHGLLDVKDNPGASFKGAKEAWKTADDKTKQDFRNAMSFIKNSLISSSKAVRNGEYKPAKERLKNES